MSGIGFAQMSALMSSQNALTSVTDANRNRTKLNAIPSAKKARENMSMEEYKQYIHSQISQISKHPSQAGANWNVLINDDGFEAMKNDPDYEAWVLDTIKTNFSTPDPFRSSTNATLWIGATKDSVHGYVEGASSKASKSSANDSENSFWQKRAERYRDQMERNQELYMERARFQARQLQASQQQDTYSHADRVVACYDANIFSGL